MDFAYGGVFGLLVLIGDIWAIVNILKSTASNGTKILWVVVVALLPLLGLVLWFIMGPRSGKLAGKL